MINKEFSYLNILLFIVLIACNSLTHEKVIGLVVSIPQFLIVFYFLLKNNFKKAFLFHLIFTVTCLAIPFSQITNPDDAHYGLFNYSKLKLLGPIGVYHVVLLIFFAKMITRKVLIDKKMLFFKLYQTLIYLGTIGIFMGIVGLIFLDYYIEYFVLYTSYFLTLFFTIFVLVRTSISVRKIFKLMLEIMIAAPLAAIIVSLFGFNAEYGGEKISIIIEVVYYSITLIFAYIHLKKFFVPIVAFFATIFLMIDGGMGGKGIIFLAILLVFFFLSVFKSVSANFNVKFRKRIVMFILIPTLVGLVIKLIAYFQSAEYNLLLYKFESVWLLFNVFQGFEGISLIPESPRVRVIEIISIGKELLSNPFYLLFGKGYGAYFSDYLNLFSGMDMKNAYKPIEMASKKYAGVHDSFSSVPLANGLVGVFLILRLVVKYAKRVNNNFMAFAAIPWLGFTFYYNVQFGIVAVLLLYASEVQLNFKNGK